MVDEILKVSRIRLSRTERQLLDKELNNPNTNNKLARFVLQTISRQNGFQKSMQTMSSMRLV